MRKDAFKWDDLRLVLAIARSGQLSAAAKGLALDAATLSRRIAALESKLGEELFYKSPRGYQLSASGEALLPHAQAMETAALAAANALNPQDSGQLSGTVRLGAPDGVASNLLAPCCAELCAGHPDLQLELVAMARHFSVSQREADLVIAVDQPNRGRQRSRRIGDYKLHLYASKALLQQHGTPRTQAELQTMGAIGYVPDVLFAPQLDFNTQFKPPLQAKLTSSNLIVQLNWTLAGAGVCVLPDFMAKAQTELQPLLVDEIEFTRSLYLLRHADDTRFKEVSDAVVAGIRQRIAAD